MIITYRHSKFNKQVFDNKLDETDKFFERHKATKLT